MAMTREERARFDGLFPLDGTEYFEPPKPLVEGLMPMREFTMLTGAPKVGKSTFAAHLTYSIATGKPFFGREVKRGHVVYIAMERIYQTQPRLHKLFELGEQEIGNVTLMSPQESAMKSPFFNSENHEDVEKLIERLERDDLKDIRLVVIDSLENTLIGSDSESKDAGPWCNGLQKLLDHFQTTALVLHHETKASESDATSNTAYRGSSVFLARSGGWLRAMAKSGGKVKLQTQRGNFGAEWSETVGFNDFGLYAASMPGLSKDKKPTLVEFVKARLAQNPMTTTTDLTELVRRHEDTQWTDIAVDRVSKAVRDLGDSVVKHDNPKDGRSKLLEFVG